MKITLTLTFITACIALLCKFGITQLVNVNIIIGFALSVLAEYMIRFFSFKSILPEPDYRNVMPDNNYLWILISPGYFFSRNFKRKIQYKNRIFNSKAKKNSKATFIKNANHHNLLLSSIIFSLVSILGLLKSTINIYSFDTIVAFLIFFVIFRTISRSIEIIYAFTNDVISPCLANSSSLNKYDRIKLALNSYIENILNFSSLYYLHSHNYKDVVEALYTSIGRNTLTNLNISNSDLFITLSTYGQVITSLTLVVLSLAIYVSRAK